ncbi:F-box/WD repeat-containing protein [Actinidia chinensis var. chinensis]|uniref:F-box/WD repeat-containing protein n=1 Tax=Actinidia chinensis var. chinensis TaxID=1590841 RepID=A0A2R6S324_ACTCC|nr:F-box/WD repeat-containing protein [Actinidia chinensis var. chinensis]
MDELKHLEEAQRTIMSMQSRGLISSSYNDSDSNRFLANFTLLMVQPCGGLDMEKKCQLIHENLPKISAVFLEEAVPCVSEEGNCEQKKAGAGSMQTDYEDMAMVGLEAMQDANSTLEDFCRSYFLFHDMDVNRPQSIFRYLPILSFTESYIYQLDRLNEKMHTFPTEGVTCLERGFHKEANQRWVIKFIELFQTDPFRPLILRLDHHGLLTERIIEELRCGKEYWNLERKLCSALASNKKILLEDVMRAIHLKSFDHRVLNLLLYQLRGEKVNELHMEFLSVSELLVELSDDFILQISSVTR